MTKAQRLALADTLEQMLASIAAGELAGSMALRHRLEGALVALWAVDGDDVDVVERLAALGDR